MIMSGKGSHLQVSTQRSNGELRTVVNLTVHEDDPELQAKAMRIMSELGSYIAVIEQRSLTDDRNYLDNIRRYLP